MRRAAVVASGFMIGIALSATSFATAGASTGYPPPPATIGSGATTATVGQTVTFTACGFKPGSTVTVSSGGGTMTANASGCVTVTVKVSDPHISVNGGPLVAVNYGPNTIVLTGVNPVGAPFTFTETITIASTAPAAVTQPASAVPSSTTSSSGLAFTGADIAYTTIGGLLLIGAGTALGIVVSRRRRAA